MSAVNTVVTCPDFRGTSQFSESSDMKKTPMQFFQRWILFPDVPIYAECANFQALWTHQTSSESHEYCCQVSRFTRIGDYIALFLNFFANIFCCCCCILLFNLWKLYSIRMKWLIDSELYTRRFLNVKNC